MSRKSSKTTGVSKCASDIHERAVHLTREKVKINSLINFAQKGSNRIKVSIVVPVCNVENFLGECLDSIINQTIKDIEIICVNDGSRDNSLQILNKYAQKDSRVKIIDKANAGYGHAMNIGMDMACGEYIGIVESDDVVELNMFETLYNRAVKNDLDWVKSDFYRYTHNQDGSINLKRVNLCPNTEYYEKVFKPNDKPECYDFTMHTWCGIYKRTFIEKNNIRHNETPGASFQDTGFFFQTFAWAERAMFINQAFYWYRSDNPGSSVKSKTKVYCIRDEYDFIMSFLNSDPEISKIVVPYCWVVRCGSYLRTFKRIAPKFKKEFIRHFHDVFKKAQERGDIYPELFPKARWDSLRQILNLPEKYYYLDKINTKIQEKGKMGLATKIFMPFHKLKWCLKDNGLRYTIKLFFQKGYEKLKPQTWTYRSSIWPHICIQGRKLLKCLHIPNKKMREIKKLRNIHKGERCFITCTGPSLRIEDLELLKDEYTIGVNTIFLAYDKTDWRPTYYTIVDAYIAQKYGENYNMDFEAFCKKDIFLNSRIKSKKSKRIHKIHVDFKNHTKSNLEKNRLYVDEDITVHINDNFTVTNMAINIAIYLGFKDIYIIGADCNYESDKLHFVPNPFDPGSAKKGRMRLNIIRMLNGYEALKVFAKSKNVNIYNATRGGHLEVFERVCFDDLFVQKENAYSQFWKYVMKQAANREVLLWGGIGQTDCMEYYKKIYGKTLRRVYFTESLTDGISTLYFPNLVNQNDKYYIVSLDSIDDEEHVNRLISAKYQLNSDSSFFLHKPIVIKNNYKTYSDEYGNKVINCPDDCVIELNGRNSSVIFEKGCRVNGNYKISIGNNSCIHIKENCRLGGAIICSDNAEILIEKECVLTKQRLLAGGGSKIVIGEMVTAPVSGSDKSVLDIRAHAGYSVYIGKDCMFSSGVVILSGSGHAVLDVKSNKTIASHKNVFIGAHVWVGLGVTVLNGAEVGSGSVIGTQSLVNKRFPNNCSIAGSPAKVLHKNVCWARNPMETNVNNLPIEFAKETVSDVKIKYLPS